MGSAKPRHEVRPLVGDLEPRRTILRNDEFGRSGRSSPVSVTNQRQPSAAPSMRRRAISAVWAPRLRAAGTVPAIPSQPISWCTNIRRRADRVVFVPGEIVAPARTIDERFQPARNMKGHPEGDARDARRHRRLCRSGAFDAQHACGFHDRFGAHDTPWSSCHAAANLPAPAAASPTRAAMLVTPGRHNCGRRPPCSAPATN